MRAAWFILFILITILGAGQVLAQSAFLDSGQSATAAGMVYQRGNHTSALGLGVSLATQGESDVNLAVFRISGNRAAAYGGSVGVTLLKNSENSNVISGLPITLEYVNPPGRESATLTGSVGLRFDAPYATGNGTHFVFSLAGSIAYILTSDRTPHDRTIEIGQVGIGQSINVGNGNFWLFSVFGGYANTSPSHGFVSFEIGLLFPDK